MTKTQVTLYLAGPMSGIPYENFPAFFAAAIELRKLGFNIINPAELDIAGGFIPAMEQSKDDSDRFPVVLRRDFQAVLDADGIVLMPGWEGSTGAPAERFVAHYSGRKIYLWDPILKTIKMAPFLKPIINFIVTEDPK